MTLLATFPHHRPLFLCGLHTGRAATGINKSGFGAGFGSIGVWMMALAVTVPQAAAILMPLLFVMDVLGMAGVSQDFDLKLLGFLIPCGLVGIVVGALLFKLLNAHTVAGIVGGFTLLFLAQRLLFAPKADSRAPPKWPATGLTSGFTSFIAHAGGPPINAYVIRCGSPRGVLPPPWPFSSLSSICRSGFRHAWLGLLDWRNLATSLVLLPVTAGRRGWRAGWRGASVRCCFTGLCRHVSDRGQAAVGRVLVNCKLLHGTEPVALI